MATDIDDSKQDEERGAGRQSGLHLVGSFGLGCMVNLLIAFGAIAAGGSNRIIDVLVWPGDAVNVLIWGSSHGELAMLVMLSVNSVVYALPIVLIWSCLERRKRASTRSSTTHSGVAP